MESAVITPDPLHEVGCSLTLRTRIATDTASVHGVGLLHFMNNTGRFREVSIGQMHIGEVRFALLIDAPADDAQLGCISETGALAGDFLFLIRAVNEFMTGLTERDQVVGTIATCLS